MWLLVVQSQSETQMQLIYPGYTRGYRHGCPGTLIDRLLPGGLLNQTATTKLVPKSDCSRPGIRINCIWSEETMSYENNNNDLSIIAQDRPGGV